MFPGGLLAGLAGVQAMPFFETPPETRPHPMWTYCCRAARVDRFGRGARAAAALDRPWCGAGLAIPAVGWPLAMRFGEGGDTRETIAGAVLLVGLVALFSVPAVLGSWRRYMARSLLDTLVAGRTDLRQIDGETHQNQAAVALGAPACDLGAFDAAGLVEPFTSAGIDHVLQGEAEGIPFVLAELRLYNAEGFEVFAGVVGGFRLQRACPGLTLVTRERGLLGNLIASAGTGIERVGLEDPDFERRFEVYGTDQVWSRTVLTTTMLERPVRLDDIAHARGFRCAFAGDHLLLALSGMRWRAPLWRVVFSLERWLGTYRAWLSELIALPAAVVREFALHPGARGRCPAAVQPQPWLGDCRCRQFRHARQDLAAHRRNRHARRLHRLGHAVRRDLAVLRLLCVRPMGRGREWRLEGRVADPLGVLYGIGAIGMGVKALGRLAWTWNAPLRNQRR